MVRATPTRITLDGGNAEVWTWRKRVTGHCFCHEQCAAVSLRVNNTEVEVEREGKRFSALVPLKEGKNRIVASCCHADGTACSSDAIILTERLKSRPTALIRMSTDSGRIVLDGSGSSPSEASGAAVVKYLWRAPKGNPALRHSTSPGKDRSILLVPPGGDGEHHVYLKVVDAEGRSDTAATCFVVQNGNDRLVRLDTENPAWVERAVIYGVVPHNFGPNGFRSVIERLDYLGDLGITALWLSPCTMTPGKGHGYAVNDYFKLRKDYGTKADFSKLVKEAHARGIRVLMDFVPNHSSIHHPYMRHAQANGKASPYYDFYDRDKDDGQPTHYFNWVYLPNLNYDNPEVRRWMLEAFSYWVRRFDVDGFRVDAAWGVKLRRPDFWRVWRRELKRIKPDLLLLAEASARDPYWFTEGFDAAYDWTDELGHWSMAKVFEASDQIVLRLHDALTNHGRGFHEDALIFRFLNNNDTGERFITRHGVDVEKVAAAMLLTLPGLPCIYTGQEIGAEFEPPKTVDPISWEDRHGLRDYYRLLISLRREIPSLHSRRWRILKVDSLQQVYAYVRYGLLEDRAVLVVLNFSRERAIAKIRLPQQFRSFADAKDLTDLLRNEQVQMKTPAQGTIEVPLSELSARILVA